MLTPSTRLGPYEIIAPLGAGGMGEVYRARDTRLGREVAVKVLPEPFATDPHRQARFEREARAVAALSHPNILAIHDYGAQGTVTFAVMELLEGETLRSLLAKGSMPWRKAVEIGTAITDGLAAAHAKGIIHRDLKPENLFLTADGRVKILDFGLARMQEPSDSSADTGPYIPADTEPGMVLGTVGYMSPEQLRAQPVDVRTDLFALGCVLYEMVAGRRAFRGASRADVMAAVLNDNPASLAGQDVPRELAGAINHCLEKDARKRFQSAHDLAFALRAMLSGGVIEPAGPPARRRRILLGGGIVLCLTLAVTAIVFGPWWRPHEPASPKPTLRSIAVLPFKNAGDGAGERDYLADGITEALIAKLAQLPDLRVTPWLTAERYKESSKTVSELASEMRVDALVTGRVRLAGNRVSVTIALIEAANGQQFWGDEVEESASDIFLVQRRIAAGVAGKLSAPLSGRQQAELARPISQSAEAYEYYLRGKAASRKGGKDANRLALDLFKKALEIDANLAEALSGIGEAQYFQYYFGWQAEERNLREAEASFKQAIRLNPSLVSAYSGLAAVYWLRGQSQECLKQGREVERLGRNTPEHLLARAEAYNYGALRDKAFLLYHRVIDLDPASYEASVALPEMCIYLGKFADAIDSGQRFLNKFGDRAPMEMHMWIGIAHHCLNDSGKAEAAYKQAIDAAPEVWQVYRRLGALYEQTGRPKEAKAIWQRGREALTRNLDAFPENQRVRVSLARFAAYLGDQDSVAAEEARLLQDAGANGHVLTGLGSAHATLGNPLRAVGYYRRALASGFVDFEMEFALKAEGLEHLRASPEFHAFLSDYHKALDRLRAEY